MIRTSKISWDVLRKTTAIIPKRSIGTDSVPVVSVFVTASDSYTDSSNSTLTAAILAAGAIASGVAITSDNDNRRRNRTYCEASTLHKQQQQQEKQFIQSLLNDAKEQNRYHRQQQQTSLRSNIQQQQQNVEDTISVPTIQATSSRIDPTVSDENDTSYLPHLSNIRRGRQLLLDAAEQQHQHKDVEEKEVQEQQQGTSTVQATSCISSSSYIEEPTIIRRFTTKPTPTVEVTDNTTKPIAVATSANASGEDNITEVVPEMSEAEASLEEAVRKAKQHSGGLKVFSGNGNMSLALDICRHLGVNLGKATVGKFADGEVNVVIQENVRGKDVYVVQPTGPPVNDNIMELLLMVSTLRRSSARRITVVIPYYGYARQDRKMQARVPISAADVARLMEAMGVDRVIAVDLHCGQIQGFFGPRVPVDNLDGGVVGLDYFACKDLHNPVIVSPDAGGVYRAKNFKDGLEHKYGIHDLSLAMIVKQRAKAGVVDQMDLVGDVRDCDCIIVDDMIDTAGTLCKASDVLIANGARRVFAFASHGLLSGPANTRIANSSLEEVVVLNTLPTSPQREANAKLTELNVAPLLSRAIFNIHAKKSISALFR